MAISGYNQNIVIGTIIHELDLNEETGKHIFKNLFEKANYYENYLVENFQMERIENQ